MGVCVSSSSSRVSPPPPNSHLIDLSHFEVISQLRVSGYSKIHLVRLRSTGALMLMKRLSKFLIVRGQDKGGRNHIHSVWTERKIMERAPQLTPFVIPMVHAFQSPQELFILMPHMKGGDLRLRLKTLQRPLSESDIRFYSAEITVAFHTLFTLKVVHRDLKPENCLIDSDGHIKLSEFGSAEIFRRKNKHSAIGSIGSAGYLAPEAVTGHSYGSSVDFFAFGVLLYELAHGTRPPRKFNSTIGDVESLRFRSELSEDFQSLVRALLKDNPSKRLGSERGWTDVMEHAFFKDLDWRFVLSKSYPPPFVPSEYQKMDSIDTNDQPEAAPKSIAAKLQKYFIGFDYNCRVMDRDVNKLGESVGSTRNDIKSAQNDSMKHQIDTAPTTSPSTPMSDPQPISSAAPRNTVETITIHANPTSADFAVLGAGMGMGMEMGVEFKDSNGRKIDMNRLAALSTQLMNNLQLRQQQCLSCSQNPLSPSSPLLSPLGAFPFPGVTSPVQRFSSETLPMSSPISPANGLGMTSDSSLSDHRPMEAVPSILTHVAELV